MTSATRPLPAVLAIPGLSALTGPVARGLLSLPFVLFGAMHFAAGAAMAGLVPSWVPGGGVLWVYLTGVALVAGGIGLWTRRFAVSAAVALAALMAVFALTVHLPNVGDAQLGQLSTISLLKDLALAGGLLAFAGLRAR